MPTTTHIEKRSALSPDDSTAYNAASLEMLRNGTLLELPAADVLRRLDGLEGAGHAIAPEISYVARFATRGITLDAELCRPLEWLSVHAHAIDYSPDERRLYLGYDAQSSWPRSVHDGTTRRLGSLSGATADAVPVVHALWKHVADLVALSEGYTEVWRDGNTYGVLNAEAQHAEDGLAELIRSTEELGLVRYWEAEEWYTGDFPGSLDVEELIAEARHQDAALDAGDVAAYLATWCTTTDALREGLEDEELEPVVEGDTLRVGPVSLRLDDEYQIVVSCGDSSEEFGPLRLDDLDEVVEAIESHTEEA